MEDILSCKYTGESTRRVALDIYETDAVRMRRYLELVKLAGGKGLLFTDFPEWARERAFYYEVAVYLKEGLLIETKMATCERTGCGTSLHLWPGVVHTEQMAMF